MSLSKPLITGAGGFIGSHLARYLGKLNEVEVIYLADLPNNLRLNEFRNSSKFRIIEGNLSEGNTVDLPTDTTAIFALAAFNGTGRFYSQPYSVLINSMQPTLRVINEYAGKVPIVYSSSSEVYASTVEKFKWEVPTDELVPPSIDSIHNTRWSYASAKLFGEIALVAAGAELGAMGTIVRYHNVYGPNMGWDHFIPDFVTRALDGRFEITGADQTRAFMHVTDAVRGTIAALSKASTSIPIYHLGTKEEMTILAAANLILAEMGLDKNEISLRPAPKGSVSRRCANPTKAEIELEWSARIDFREGIKDFLQSFISLKP
jgi:UDP-glucose 4-epimerase